MTPTTEQGRFEVRASVPTGTLEATDGAGCWRRGSSGRAGKRGWTGPPAGQRWRVSNVPANRPRIVQEARSPVQPGDGAAAFPGAAGGPLVAYTLLSTNIIRIWLALTGHTGIMVKVAPNRGGRYGNEQDRPQGHPGNPDPGAS